MFLVKLKEIFAKNNLTLREAEKKTGISYAYLNQLLLNKRPLSKEKWLKILKGLEGLTEAEAEERLKVWNYHEAQKNLPQHLQDSRQIHYGPAFREIERATEKEVDTWIGEIKKINPKILKKTPSENLSLLAKKVILRAFYSKKK